MSGRIALLVAGLLVAALPAAVRAETCATTETHHAVSLSGEVAGAHQFSADLGHGWTFVLSPARAGWDIEVRDDTGYNLALATMPLHGDTNPRMLYGWHFRNLANTGPNEGDVNAPQLERRFALNDPREGAFRGAGLGWLDVQDYGLADLNPGQRARMVYLRFEACVLIPKTEEEQVQDAELASPDYLPEEIEMIRTCGLDAAWRPEAWVMPRMLGGDFDGDDALDIAVPVSRVSDGAHGFAVCRAGTWSHVFGPDGVPPGSDLTPAYFEQVEAWAASPRADVPDYYGDPGLPEGPGDVIIIERIEKSAYSIFWDGTGFRSHHHYTLIEP